MSAVAAIAKTGESGEVECIDTPTPELFARCVAARRPVLIRGAMEDWPARQKWSAEYFTERYGDRPVPVAGVREKRVITDPVSGIPYRDELLGELIARLRGSAPCDAYAMILLDQTLTELLDDLPTPSFAPPAPWAIRKFWLSAADTRTPLHMDLPENLFAQFVGRKRVSLFAPRQELRMYRHAPWTQLPQVSRVDGEAPDLQRFPRFAAARALRCEVGPGDLLYIPRLWWHQVRSLEFSVSVNYWWANGWTWQIVRAALAYQRLRKIRY